MATPKKTTAAQEAKANANAEAQATPDQEAQTTSDQEAQATASSSQEIDVEVTNKPEEKDDAQVQIETTKAASKKSFKQVTPDFLEVKTIKGVASFRRAGLAFTQQPTVIPVDDLSEDQITALMSEPRLVVTLIAEDAE